MYQRKKLNYGETSSTNNIEYIQDSLPLLSSTTNEKDSEEFFANK